MSVFPGIHARDSDWLCVLPLKRVIVICMKFSRLKLFLVALVAHLLPLVAFDAFVALVALAHRK